MITDEEIISYIWHYKAEDNLSWDFCAGVLKEYNGIEISAKELEKRFKKYFKKMTGIAPYTKCPLCKNKTIPKQNKYGYFIGCSNFPKCEFLASDKKPYTPNK